MKHLKKFEQNINEPEIGDYVICRENITNLPNLKNFLKNNIGQILDVNINKTNFIVQYENIPSWLTELFNYGHSIPNCRSMQRHEIVEFANSSEELKLKLMQLKYNL